MIEGLNRPLEQEISGALTLTPLRKRPSSAPEEFGNRLPCHSPGPAGGGMAARTPKGFAKISYSQVPYLVRVIGSTAGGRTEVPLNFGHRSLADASSSVKIWAKRPAELRNIPTEP